MVGRISAGRPVRIRMVLKDADVFSFRFRDQEAVQHVGQTTGTTVVP
jgi:hypothetical protein